VKNGLAVFARKQADRLLAAGFAAYAVGGCVRDTLLGRRPHDWDLATDASCAEVAALFPRTVPTGARYGTVTVFAYGGRCEITTFRREGTYTDGRRPDGVAFVSDIREDLARRDLTVNAMAMSPDGALTDPFGGRADLDRRLIRCVGEPEARFTEDALRMFRAVRFAAELGFDIEEKTAAAIARCAPLAARLSAERVREETERMLCSPRPSAVAEAVGLGLYDAYLARRAPDLAPLEKLPKKPLYRWCALTAALLRCGAIEDGEAFLRALRLDKKTVRLAAFAAGTDLPPDGEGLRLFLARHGVEEALCAAAAAGRYGAVRRAVRAGGYVPVSVLAVGGRELETLGLRGEAVGETLARLAADATRGAVANERAALLEKALFYEKMRRKA